MSFHLNENKASMSSKSSGSKLGHQMDETYTHYHFYFSETCSKRKVDDMYGSNELTDNDIVSDV